jgi:hypothetical protein
MADAYRYTFLAAFDQVRRVSEVHNYLTAICKSSISKLMPRVGRVSLP